MYMYSYPFWLIKLLVHRHIVALYSLSSWCLHYLKASVNLIWFVSLIFILVYYMSTCTAPSVLPRLTSLSKAYGPCSCLGRPVQRLQALQRHCGSCCALVIVKDFTLALCRQFSALSPLESTA